ncbi:hypothetical protein tpqmel_0087 [Candidatus Gastranaerophilus sp. (ex Termes propinquus)]|nr:hypothetical protein tpqmel_0087 [Candidatus Gastranaerophilus sp. (ex Termes propinquus)]
MQKATQLKRPVVKNLEDQEAIACYIKFLSKRARIYYIKRDYENSADDLRTILFLLQNCTPNVRANYEKRLERSLEKMCFDTSSENRFEVAKNLYLEKNYFAAAYEFLSLLDINYRRALCLEYLGNIFLIFDKKEQALNYYLLAASEGGDSPVLNLKLAKLYDELSKPGLAMEYYSNIMAVGADREILEEIVTIFNEKIKQDPKNPLNYEVLAAAHQWLGEYGVSYPLYQKAIELNPNDIFLKYLLGSLLHEMAQYGKAIEVYDSILYSNPYESQIRIGKAKCLEKIKKFNEAVREYQVVLAIYPDSLSAQYGIVKILAPQKGLKGAVSSFYPLTPDFVANSDFYLKLARFLDNKNEYKLATEAYRLSIEKNKTNAAAYLELYDIYITHNNQAAAHELTVEAYKNLPNNAEVRALYSSLNKDNVLKKTP